MGKTQLLPDKCRILSGSVLKLIAIISMLIDHVGGHLVPRSIVLFSISGYNLTLQYVMRSIGRLAFPIFAFLLIEGLIHTHNRIKYGASLLICAFISEIPWDLLHYGKFFELQKGQNVFFTLFIGFLALCIAEALKNHPLFAALSLIAIGIAVPFLVTDFGVKGYLFIVLLYALKENEVFRILPAFLLNNFVFSMLAFLPISMYNGKRGFVKGAVLKYAFYLFYPVHLLVIYLIKINIS